MNDPASVQRVLYWVARKAGLVPAGDNANLDPDMATEILIFMDDRLREAWDTYNFVETTMCDERSFRDDFDATKCYEKGAIVWDPCTRAYYSALLTETGGPLNNASVWAPAPSVSPRWVPWKQTNRLTIGTCFGAWTSNPYETTNRRRLWFEVSRRGLEFTNCPETATAWLVYRVPYPGIGLAEWDATLTYSVGDTVYDAPDSWYSLIDGNKGKDPATSPDAWVSFRVPYPMVRFVQQAAYSDTLITAGQNEKAPNELQMAYGFLGQAFDQQQLQQGQRENWTGYSG
ncbi:MAG TPA: hypothetical protein VFO40_05090 [Chthoniobacterales bacterium]|nr:hypothetical protein [Chthoniobacterales bacterium]